MTGFYVSIVFIGSMLIVVSLVLMAYDSKKSYDYKKDINDKQRELSLIINDAEQMIQELNRFSEYVVSRIEQKSEELGTQLKELDKRMEIVNTSSLNAAGNLQGQEITGSISAKDELVSNEPVVSNLCDIANQGKGKKTEKGRTGHLSARHKEIIKLAENGLSEMEIAKKLNIGMGEIQLVLGLKKQ